jgi:transposase
VLLPPHSLRPYVSRNKTDNADARALLEAHRNHDIHPVPLKSGTASADGAASDAGHVGDRVHGKAQSASCRPARGGLGHSVGARHVIPRVQLLVGDPESGLPEPLRVLLPSLCQEFRTLEENVQQVERQLRLLSKQTPQVQRLMSIPGMGLTTATALVAFVGDVWRFPSCRHFASYLGLTPREYSSGLIRRLGGISK